MLCKVLANTKEKLGKGFYGPPTQSMSWKLSLPPL
jgi:hypothetical protein